MKRLFIFLGATAIMANAVIAATSPESLHHSPHQIKRPASIHSHVSSSSNTRQNLFYKRLIAAALERTSHTVTYDPVYVSIPYPNGDVPDNKGVCTDVVVRAYRKAGIDLQKEVHEDMKKHFHLYPNRWGLKQPDPNIDHRRVHNLMTYFKRKGAALPVTRNPQNYTPGDIVVWKNKKGWAHIGIVINRTSTDGKRPLIVHNICRGPEIEDFLFRWEIIGHYRYSGVKKQYREKL